MPPTPIPQKYERSAASSLSFEDLDQEALSRYVRQRAPYLLVSSSLEQAAIRLGILVKSGSHCFPSVLGALMFGYYPQLQSPNWGISVVHVDGISLADPILKRQDIEGSIPQMLPLAMEFIRAHARALPDMIDPNTVTNEYSMQAVEEALINGLVHRDLRMTGRVSVRIFEDRLEVWSPGGSSIPLEELSHIGGISLPRNPLLAAAGRALGIGEQLGRGLLLMRKTQGKLTQAPVLIRTSKADVLVTIPSALCPPPEVSDQLT